MVGKEIKKCVVGIARNEDPYIEEWLNHYKNIGFSRAIVFDNNDKPTLGRIVEKAGLGSFCTVDNRYVGKRTFVQLEAYRAAFSAYHWYFDWMAFFDIDEFLDTDGTVDEFLSRPEYLGFDAVRIHWRIFGDCGLTRWSDEDVVERFDRPLDISFDENMQCKSIIRCSASPSRFSCHGAAGISSCDTLGKKCETFRDKNSGPVVWDVARLNHYRTKTIEEFMKCKYARGDDWNRFSNKLSEFFKINEVTDEKLAIIKEYSE